MDTHKRLVVVGQGYVGLPLAMRAVEAGYTIESGRYVASVEPRCCVGFDIAVITVPTRCETEIPTSLSSRNPPGC